MILPGQKKTALSLRNSCDLARQRPGNVFKRIGARRKWDRNEKHYQNRT